MCASQLLARHVQQVRGLAASIWRRQQLVGQHLEETTTSRSLAAGGRPASSSAGISGLALKKTKPALKKPALKEIAGAKKSIFSAGFLISAGFF